MPVAPEVRVVLDLAPVRRLTVDRADDAVGTDLEGMAARAQDVVAVRALWYARAAAVDRPVQRREVDDECHADRRRSTRRRHRQESAERTDAEDEQPTDPARPDARGWGGLPSHDVAGQQASRGAAAAAPLRVMLLSHFFASAWPACAVAY